MIMIREWVVCASFSGSGFAARPGLASGGQTSVQEPASLKLEVAATPFIARDGSGLKQMLRVMVDNPGTEARGEVRAKLGTAEEIRLPLAKISSGKSEHALFIPEIKSASPATFILQAGGRTVSVEKTLSPPRKWTLYLFPHSHTDIGYTELQTRVFKNHVEYLDDVIEFCRDTDDYPDEAKFRWNIEVSWALQNYIRQPARRTGRRSSWPF